MYRNSIYIKMKDVLAMNFSQSAFGSGSSGFGSFNSAQTAVVGATNPNKDIEVSNPPDDSIQCMAFSPQSVAQNFLIAGSWDNNVRCWEVQNDGKTIGKAQQSMGGPVLDVTWHDDGTKVFMASADKTVQCWDLASNQKVQVAQHDAPVKVVRWIKSPTYNCIMTGSWDKTLKFWDTRSPAPILTLNLPERCYCADVDYPMAVVGTANKNILIYELDGQPREYKQMESPLKYQHRCVAIFKDRKQSGSPPAGFALGSVEGRVAIQYILPVNPRDNFTFKCHRSNGTTSGYQEIFAVNDIKFHPVHGTLATVGSDGRYSFWDKDARTKLKTSDAMEQPITSCGFSSNGLIFAYAVSYDWSKGHEHYNAQKKNFIYLHSCYEDLKPRTQTR